MTSRLGYMGSVEASALSSMRSTSRAASPKLAIERALNMIGPREASHFVECSRKDVEKWLRLVV